MLSHFPREEITYCSSYATSMEEGNFEIHEIYSTKFLNTIKRWGLPNHSTRLEGGADAPKECRPRYSVVQWYEIGR